MRPKEVRTLYRAQPFRPLVLHLADGRSVQVDHPELMALSPNGRSATIYLKNSLFEIVDVMLVTSAELVNGSRTRGRKA